MATKRREPEHSVRVVYLVVNRQTGEAVSAHLTRDGARSYRGWLDNHGWSYDSRQHRVERQELVRSSRKEGGA